MHFFFTTQPSKQREDETGNNMLVPLGYHERNTNEGSEFLDDAIRMDDMPLPGKNNIDSIEGME